MARILGATSCHSIQPFPGMARGVPCHLAPLPPPAAHPLGAQILEIAIPSPTEKTKNRRRKARQTGHCMPQKRPGRHDDAADGEGRRTRSRAGAGRRESDSGGAKADTSISPCRRSYILERMRPGYAFRHMNTGPIYFPQENKIGQSPTGPFSSNLDAWNDNGCIDPANEEFPCPAGGCNASVAEARAASIPFLFMAAALAAAVGSF